MHKHLLPLLLIVCLLTGCAAYVSNRYADRTLSTAPAVEDISLTTSFSVNGKPATIGANPVFDVTTEVLEESGYFRVSDNPDARLARIHVAVNNKANLGTSALKGFFTGLTLYIIGSNITDEYDIDISYQANGKHYSKQYPHTLVNVLGILAFRPKEPEYRDSTFGGGAFREVMADVVKAFILDMRKDAVR
jgi:hypothetical protein